MSGEAEGSREGATSGGGAGNGQSVGVVDEAAGAAAPGADDAALVEALRRGEEAAFATLIERYHRALVRLALAYVADQAAAEDVVQETWLGVVQGIDRFAGRASLKTWICRILSNRAMTRGQRNRRTVAFSALCAREIDDDHEPAVDPDRFHPDGPSRGHWSIRPQRWTETPESRLLSGEVRALCARAIDALPPAQRTVITLRDVEGWEPAEVCAALEITDGNQRVLLHRARARVRAALDLYFAPPAAPPAAER